MKKQSVVVTLSLFVMSLIVPAFAQMSLLTTVSIPFDFTVGEKVLPAGRYIVERTAAGNVLALSNPKQKLSESVVTSLVEAREASTTSRLEFRRYGDRYFLARVWSEGNSAGRELSPSRQEREIAKGAAQRLARQRVRPEIISIVAE